MLAGVSTRRYPVALEPVGQRIEEQSRSTSKSAVSRKFVTMTETALTDLLAKDLSEVDLVALMIDGVHFADHLCVVALGIDIQGTKHPLALVEGSTENTTLVRGLLVGLRERGLDTTKPILAVLDGAKALAAAVKEVFDHRSSVAARSTRSATSVTTCPRRCADRSRSGSARPTAPAPRSRLRPSWSRWPRSWTRPTQAPPAACARA